MSPRYLFPNPGRLTVSIVDWGRPFLEENGESFPLSAAPTRQPFLIVTAREEEFKKFFFPPTVFNCATLPTRVDERGTFLREISQSGEAGSWVVFVTPTVHRFPPPLLPLLTVYLLRSFSRSSPGVPFVRARAQSDSLVDKMIQCSPCAITLSFGTSSMLRMWRTPSIPLS